MKRNKINIKTIILLFVTGLLVMNACQEDEKEYPRTRLFQPVLNEDLEAIDNTILVNLGDMKDASFYSVEISRDSFATIDYSFETDTNFFLINSDLIGEDLLWYTIYQVRATAYADETKFNSLASLLGNVRTQKFPSNQGTPTMFDALDTRAKVFWTRSGAPITGIKVYGIDDLRLTTPLLEYDVSDEERDSSEKVVGGLMASTQYQIAIFSGDQVRGWEIYTTRAALVEGDNVIDLTGVPTDTSTLLADTLAAIADGSVILLEGGKIYTTGGYALDKSVTIMSGYSFTPALPTIDCSSNFDLLEGSNVGLISFKDIYFTGDFGGNYVLNISQGGTIGEIKFESCRMHSLRGITRIKGGVGTIDKFTMIDCIADSINGYGVFYVDKDTWSAGDVLLENSTFSKIIYFLASRSSTNSVTIESCTLNEVPEAGRQMFRWRGSAGANDIVNGLKIHNSIIGAGWDMDLDGTVAVKGSQGLANTPFDFSNCYTTSDFSFSSDPLPAFPNFVYTGTAAELWIDAFMTVDFNIADNGFAGKGDSGDPRWRVGL